MLDMKKLLTKTLITLKTPLKVSSVTKSIGKASGSSVAISAPTVSGYSFLCWISSATSGWVGATYVQNITSQNTNIWVAAPNGSGTGNVIAFALYVKNP